MKAAVISFPGSNCDFDMYYALNEFGVSTDIISANTTDLSTYDAIFLPGGFAYGDYLRTGAVARFSPVMSAVSQAAYEGKYVVGICNGFQILTEAGLLPGQLRGNAKPGFICDEVLLNVANGNTAFSSNYGENAQIKIPVAHGEGNFYADDATLQSLHDNNQVVFTYNEDINGSADNIAGITNEKGNVFGMMPHPERAIDELLGNTDGQGFFKSLVETLVAKVG